MDVPFQRAVTVGLRVTAWDDAGADRLGVCPIRSG